MNWKEELWKMWESHVYPKRYIEAFMESQFEKLIEGIPNSQSFVTQTDAYDVTGELITKAVPVTISHLLLKESLRTEWLTPPTN